MKTYFITLLILMTCSVAVKSQQVGPSISWDEPTYDFGDVKEDGGKVTHKFSFTNTGSEPLVITNVRPSCGCTSSDYTKEPVPAGGKGYVSASFNPLRRVGKNSKSVTVTTNGTPPTTTLRFTVNVLAKPRTIEDDFPRVMGDLRLKTNHLALMKITTEEVKNGDIPIVNTKDFDINIEFRNVPAHIKVTTEPETLKPGAKGKIKVTYDASKKNDYGFLMDRVTVAVNGNTNSNKNKLSISATIEEDFSKLTAEEKENAPKIVFESKIFDFATINQGEKRDYVYKFKNEGKSDLLIRKTKAACGCTVVNPSKNLIKPGESAELKVTFNSAGKKNKQNKSITVITNDPNQSQVVLRVKGMVLDPKSNN